MLHVSQRNGGAAFAVRVVPRASRNEIAGLHGEAIRIRLTAPPVEGAANKALTKFLAELLGVSKRDIEIVSGHSGRHKVVWVHDLSPQKVRARLQAHLRTA
jgi:uncharacterized protein (TIGR00251 family)